MYGKWGEEGRNEGSKKERSLLDVCPPYVDFTLAPTSLHVAIYIKNNIFTLDYHITPYLTFGG